MARHKQYLLSPKFKIQKEFGGSLLKKSHAKGPRPVSVKSSMHLTLRSSIARGRFSFLASSSRRSLIENKIQQLANKFGVKIYKIAVVSNHIHILLRASSRRGFISFLRGATGVIARIVLGAEKGRAQLNSDSPYGAIRFWDQRPWTRIVSWVKDFVNVKNYVQLNFNEAMGFIAYNPRLKRGRGYPLSQRRLCSHHQRSRYKTYS